MIEKDGFTFVLFWNLPWDEIERGKIVVVRAYPRTHYEELKNYGYRIIHFEDIITHLTECHYHDYYELSIVLSCKNVVYICGQTEYPIVEGDIILCNVFEPHYYKEVGPDAHCERFNLGIEFTKLLQFSMKNINLSLLFQKYNASYPIIHLGFNELLKYYELIGIYKKNKLKHSNEILQSGLIQLLLAYIYEDAYQYLETDIRNAENIQVVTMVVEYIHDHLSENITLSQLAKEANYSVSYICSAFKNVMNKTINNYIKEKRLDLAIQYIRNDIPISEAAEKAGFNNYSYFYKVFRSVYGISPLEFRDRNPNSQDKD